MWSVHAVNPQDLDAGRPQFRERFPESHAASQPTFRRAREGTNRKLIADLLLHAERQRHFLEVRERLEKEQLGSALEQSRDLLPETFGAIDPERPGLIPVDAERTDTSSDDHVLILRGLSRELRGRAIKFHYAIFESKAFQAHRIGSEGVGFHHARPGRDILLVDCAHSPRLADVELFETTLKRHPLFKEQRAYGPIAADGTRLEFIEQIHWRWD